MEIFPYPRTEWNPSTKSGGLFIGASAPPTSREHHSKIDGFRNTWNPYLCALIFREIRESDKKMGDNSFQHTTKKKQEENTCNTKWCVTEKNNPKIVEWVRKMKWFGLVRNIKNWQIVSSRTQSKTDIE